MSSVVYFQFSILCCAAWCKKSPASSWENVFFQNILFEERVGYRSSVKGANFSITNTANFNVRIILREVPLPGWMPASCDGFALQLFDLIICAICHGVMGLPLIVITTLLMCGALNFDAILYLTIIYWQFYWKIYHLLKDFMKDMQNGFINKQEFNLSYLIMNLVLLFKFMV